MKKFILILTVALLTMSHSFAGENPKLFKEINRKVKIDFSNLKICNRHKDYVVVKFRIVNSAIEIFDIDGSHEELEKVMIQELEDMFIKTDADPNQIHQYRFSFKNE